MSVGVVLGRFQPLHLGHCALIRTAAEENNHLMVLVGSSKAPPSPKNPYCYQCRYKMISEVFPQANISGIPDFPGDDAKWVEAISNVVGSLNGVVFYGNNKDASTYYLFDLLSKVFPVKHVEITHEGLSGTSTRGAIFAGEKHKYPHMLPPEVIKIVEGKVNVPVRCCSIGNTL